MSNIKDLADPNIDRVLIYAGDGGCYWRQSGCGYTYAHTAGVFTRAEAYSLAGHCGPEKRIELHSVPDDHVPTIQAENAALREQLSIATGERDALREAAAGWQALAEKLEACASVFLAEIAIKTGDDGDELTLEFGRLINREKVIEATHTLFEFPTPADVLSAHDWKVRAKVLREAYTTICAAMVQREDKNDTVTWSDAACMLAEMADAALCMAVMKGGQ